MGFDEPRHRIELARFETRAGQRTVGDVSSPLELDVVIPAVAKDEPTLPYAVEGLRRNLRHPLGKISILGQAEGPLCALAERLGCSLVDERSLLPLQAADIDYVHRGRDRSGWLFQQLLKLAADRVTGRAHFLVIDADVVLTQPQVFERQGAPLLLHSDEHHEPYFTVCEKLLGFPRATDLSCIAHMMLFEVERLRALKAHLEQVHACRWHDAILRHARYDEHSGFSEYELYGQWCLTRFPAQTLREYWFSAPLQRSELAPLPDLEAQFGPRYRSLAFHSYDKRDRPPP